jgi:hypothetical protein
MTGVAGRTLRVHPMSSVVRVAQVSGAQVSGYGELGLVLTLWPSDRRRRSGAPG